MKTFKRLIVNIFLTFGILFIILAISMEFLFLSLIGLICLIISIIFMISLSFDKKREQEELLSYIEKKEQQGYKCILRYSNTFLFVNEKKKEWFLDDNHIYNFNDVVKTELIEDDNTVTTINSKKKASVGKGLIGGAIFGEAGAIIGGTSGKTISQVNTKNYCHKLQVKVTVNDINNPVIYIDFINRNISKSSNTYFYCNDLAQKCLSIFEIIINNKK